MDSLRSDPSPSTPAPGLPNPQPFRFRGWRLAALTITYGLAWWFMLAGAVGSLPVFSLSLAILWLIGLFVIAADPRKFGIRPRSRSESSVTRKLGIGCLALLTLPLVPLALLFVPAVYSVRAIRSHYRTTQRWPYQQVRAGWQWFHTCSWFRQVALASAALVVACAFCSTTTLVIGSGNGGNGGNTPASAPPSSGASGHIVVAATQTPRSAVTANPTTTPTPKPTATPIPAATPTRQPTVQSTATTKPRPAPTSTRAPTPIPRATQCTTLNCNPWGYSFNPGQLIYHPPATFCDYFACIPSFWTFTKGYVEECRDLTFSHSGGRSGSCSHHGGNARPLYAH